MALPNQDIRDEGTRRATIGLGSKKFFEVVEHFKTTYEDFLDETIEQRRKGAKDATTFAAYADLLFFQLYSIK